MKLYIPELGDKIKLSKDWEFTLCTEDRNEVLYLAAGFRHWNVLGERPTVEERKKQGWAPNPKRQNYLCPSDWSKSVVLPADTILTIDRIYIRKGFKDYSSVSFNIDKKSLNKEFSPFIKNLAGAKGKARFWAKLGDVNKIHFDEEIFRSSLL